MEVRPKNISMKMSKKKRILILLFSTQVRMEVHAFIVRYSQYLDVKVKIHLLKIDLIVLDVL